MNHLPFDWSDAVDDNHVMAHFIGGAWDGKTYAIPRVPEWSVAVLPIPNYKFINKAPEKLLQYDIAIYKQTVCAGKEAIYWFARLEKADE